SIMTRSLLEKAALKPRERIIWADELSWVTCKLVTRRSNSGRLVAADRRISSSVITCMAEATSVNFSGLRDTVVTSNPINSSKLIFFNSSVDTLSVLVWATAAVLKKKVGKKAAIIKATTKDWERFELDNRNNQ